jgi:hypothetical protein
MMLFLKALVREATALKAGIGTEVSRPNCWL